MNTLTRRLVAAASTLAITSALGLAGATAASASATTVNCAQQGTVLGLEFNGDQLADNGQKLAVNSQGAVISEHGVDNWNTVTATVPAHNCWTFTHPASFSLSGEHGALFAYSDNGTKPVKYLTAISSTQVALVAVAVPGPAQEWVFQDNGSGNTGQFTNGLYTSKALSLNKGAPTGFLGSINLGTVTLVQAGGSQSSTELTYVAPPASGQ